MKSRVLWIIQVLLALVFLFAGGVKLITPATELTKQTPMLSAGFLRFVGVCEVLGALGLILPGLCRIKPGLTPLAAAGLVGIMIGATVVTIMTNGVVVASIPAAVGLLAGFIAYSRWKRHPELAKASTAARG